MIQLVAEDVSDGLAAMFEARDEGFVVREPFEEGIGDDKLAAVPWSYTCAHVGDFRGVLPTGRTMRIDGVTIVDRRGGEDVFVRYVDWAAVFGQLGMTVSTRVAVTPEEYAFGLDRFRELHEEPES
jgi:hypothetical protein